VGPGGRGVPSTKTTSFEFKQYKAALRDDKDQLDQLKQDIELADFKNLTKTNPFAPHLECVDAREGHEESSSNNILFD